MSVLENGMHNPYHAAEIVEAPDPVELVKSYSVRHFQALCLFAGHSFPHFTTEALTQCDLCHAAPKTGQAFLSRIKPALVYSIWRLPLGKVSCFTPTVDLLLSGGKPSPGVAKIYPLPNDHVGLACSI